MVDQCSSDDTDTEVNLGCLLFKVCTYLSCFLNSERMFCETVIVLFPDNMYTVLDSFYRATLC